MALTGELTHKGLTIAAAYLKVMQIHHRAVDTQNEDGTFTPSVANTVNKNIVKQTYLHLKTLDTYKSLTDC